MLAKQAPMKVKVLALMCACNDLQSATRFLVKLNKGESINDTDGRILNAERLYCIRLIAGHLNEGLLIFNDLQGDHEARAIYEKFNKQEIRELEQLRKESGSSSGLRFKYLKFFRNKIVFHYDYEIICNNLKEFEYDAKSADWNDIVFVDKIFESRFIVADNLLARSFGRNRKEIEVAIQKFPTTTTLLVKFLRSYLMYSGFLKRHKTK